MFRIANFIRFFDNFSNPILVKEIRQAVKGKFLIVVLGLILTIQLFMWWMFTLPTTFQSFNGESAYIGLLLLFGLSLGVCMPIYTGWRILVERVNQDLLYVSALSPFQIVWGKFLASASIIFIVFSTFLPFFYLTLLLGGIDVLTITYSLLMVVMGLLTSVTFTIFLLCGVVPIVLRVVLVLGFFAGNIYLGTLVFLSAMTAFDWYGPIDQGLGFYACLWWLIGGILVNGLFIVLSAAIISPSSSNRAVVPRIYTSVMIFLSLMTAVAFFYLAAPVAIGQEQIEWFATVIGTLVLIVGGLLFIISASGRFTYGLRLRNAIPNRFAAKVVWFPFYSGAANGLCWSLFFIASGFSVCLFIWQFGLTGNYSVAERLDDVHSGTSIYRLLCYFNYVAIYTWIGMLIFQITQRFIPFIWTIFLAGIASLVTVTIYLSFLQGLLSPEQESWSFVFLPNGPYFIDGNLIVVLTILTSIVNFALFVTVAYAILLPQFREYFGVTGVLGMLADNLSLPETAVAQDKAIPANPTAPSSVEQKLVDKKSIDQNQTDANKSSGRG